MPTLYRFPGGRVCMYAGDHGSPHFHVETPDARCSVEIDTLHVLAGTVSARELATALEWARDKRPLLMRKWKELNA